MAEPIRPVLTSTDGVKISYKGKDIKSLSSSSTATLRTKGKYLEDNVTVTYTKPSGGATPSGTKTITANGTYDVTIYASAKVNVPLPNTHYTYVAIDDYENQDISYVYFDLTNVLLGSSIVTSKIKDIIVIYDVLELGDFVVSKNGIVEASDGSTYTGEYTVDGNNVEVFVYDYWTDARPYPFAIVVWEE